MARILLLLLAFIAIAFTIYSQNTDISSKTTGCNKPGTTNLPTDTLISLKSGNNRIQVYLKFPVLSKPIGCIVLLPGWNYSVTEWCSKTTLCEKALKQGYVLIMPEMAKSIYADQLYPETRKDWLIYATRTWFKDTLITYIQANYELLLPHQKNYVLGLSTGARGAALLCLDCPNIFKKGAALSGDYDQTRMPKDALMTGYYGSIEKFPERWTGMDNIVYRFKDLKVPIYLGHGKADKVVPVDQTIQLADSLKKYKPDFVKCHIDETSGHTYEYWNSEVDTVLAFFAN